MGHFTFQPYEGDEIFNFVNIFFEKELIPPGKILIHFAPRNSSYLIDTTGELCEKLLSRAWKIEVLEKLTKKLVKIK